MKRVFAVAAVVALILASLSLTGCHKLGLVKSAPKHSTTASSTAQ